MEKEAWPEKKDFLLTVRGLQLYYCNLQHICQQTFQGNTEDSNKIRITFYDFKLRLFLIFIKGLHTNLQNLENVEI